MIFAEKLKRLTADRKKSVLADRAGLPATAITNYISKPKVIPGSDVALRLARVLGVDVDWLIDEQQDWPPVRVTKRQIIEQHNVAEFSAA